MFVDIVEVSFNRGESRIKIHNDSTRDSEKPHIVEKLSAMDWKQRLNGFAFNNDIAFTKEIHAKLSVQHPSFV